MIPIIVVSPDIKISEDYIANLIKKEKFVKFSIHRIYPESNTLGIDQIRGIKNLLFHISKHRKLIIIYQFETAKREAQNALLKTLEDDFIKAQFILLVKSESQVLETVVSRCKVIKIKEKEKKGTLNQFTVPNLIFDTRVSKDTAIEILDKMIESLRRTFRSRVVDKKNYSSLIVVIKEIQKTRQLVMTNNINPQIALDHVTLFFEKRYST